MLYRRFGRTQLHMPVFSCGGMRFQQSWNDSDKVSPDNQHKLETIVERALSAGINHIETARGYGTSEEQLGHILPTLPRAKLIVQTKVAPEADPKKFLQNFERSMSLLKLEYVDLFGLHGINTAERLTWSTRKGGCLDAALELKRQGRVRHIGFSTHATFHSTQLIVDAINDGRFEYVNLHYFYVQPFNWRAIEAAARHDMGVFIISPSDKGGKLYAPSQKLSSLTAPLSPIVFNNLWCLLRPEIHTLSVGAASPGDFDEHLKSLTHLQHHAEAAQLIATIESRLQAELERTFGAEWVAKWPLGLPDWSEVPGQINVLEILRLRNFAKAFDMLEYGKMRYNLLGNGDHWFPGQRAEKLSRVDLTSCLKQSPFAKLIPAALAEAHELLSGADVKRLGKH